MAVRVQREVFDAAAEVQALVGGRTDVGSVVTFTGLVRGDAGGRALRSLTLEHYPDMTEAELLRIEAEARERFGLAGSLVSPHRQAAFDAAAFLMDYLKSRAPFWKKEAFEDGTETWVDARETDAAALGRWGVPVTQK
ncbi:MAG: molybdenum cofactor biosynthesis protein MoaE [Rhizobiales bacterium]|nr:molybdenum cofactor biosynthesis protein MoaE [Hyphomicrobiales bacterium]